MVVAEEESLGVTEELTGCKTGVSGIVTLLFVSLAIVLSSGNIPQSSKISPKSKPAFVSLLCFFDSVFTKGGRCGGGACCVIG